MTVTDKKGQSLPEPGGNPLRERHEARQDAPWVRVVIVNYNSGPLLADTVAALAFQTDPEFEAVIVDNASTDGSADSLVLPDSRFRLVRAGANLGFAAASNLGAGGSQTRWLAMLNPDAVPEPDWLASLKMATLRYPQTAAFGSTQLDARDPRILDGGGDSYSIYGLGWRGGNGGSSKEIHGDIRVFSPCAAAALYRRDVFESLGGFAESFFCYLEDVDLGFRFNLRGHETIQLAGARVRHVGTASSGGSGSRFAFYYALRNSVFVVVRCMPFPLLVVALPLLVMTQVWSGVRRGSLGPRLKAVRDGLASSAILLRQRRAIQADRRISVWEVARLLVWNPRSPGRLAIVPLPRKMADCRPDP